VAIASLATAAIAVPLAADDPFADPEQASGQLTPRPASRIDATVRTPIAGTVLEKPIAVGQVISSAT